MGKYLTSGQYLRADDGLLSVNNLSPSTLRRFITRAEAMIDGYVGFDARYGGFEPHDTWWQARWDEHTLKTYNPIWPVPFRRAKRYRIQISMLGDGSTGSSGGTGGTDDNGGFFATIANGDVAYNTQGNYVEIVPLQAVLYSMLPAMIELGMNPPVVQVDMEMGYYFDAVNEIADDSGNHQTYYTQRGQWATTYDQQPSIRPNTLPIVAQTATNPGGLTYIVYKNGVAQTSGLTVDPVEGSIVFTSANTASDKVTCSYTYQIPDAVHEATICQVTYLLAQRELNRQGMAALDAVQNAQQMMTRHSRSGNKATGVDEPSMDPTAIQLLSEYAQWPFA